MLMFKLHICLAAHARAERLPKRPHDYKAHVLMFMLLSQAEAMFELHVCLAAHARAEHLLKPPNRKPMS